MKALRGLKRPKILKDEDPQKSAEQKLALFSQQPFNQQNSNSYRWAFPETQYKILKQQTQQAKKVKLTKLSAVSPKTSFKKNIFFLKEQVNKTNDLKKYCQIYCNHENSKCDSLFPQKKSLSLTNYMLFDKRRPSLSNQKINLTKNQQKKIKLLRLKKLLLPKQQKKISFSSQKIKYKSELNTSHRADANHQNFSPSYKRKNSFQQSPKYSDSRETNRSFLQVSRVLSSIIKRKQVPNMTVQRCHKSYFTAKNKLEGTKYLESTMSSSKLKLHEHFEKYAY